MPETIDATIAYDKSNAEQRAMALKRLENVQFSPLEAQVAFIKELIKSPEMTKEFFSDPKEYAVSHGILMDPVVVQKVQQQVLFDVALDEDFARAAGPYITKDIVDMRDRLKFGEKPVGVPGGGDPMGPISNAAVVAAAAAVAVAVVEVVTMVVTLVRMKKPEDLVSLQGLGDLGILLPNGATFVDRTGIRSMERFANLTRGAVVTAIR